MTRSIAVPSSLAAWIVAAILFAPGAPAQELSTQAADGWQSPPADVMEVLYAPQLPRVWTA
ncbi:MAG: hypothetical protein M8857_00315, partial [marine benthic group bacterium]|nr:hypothetical protein [Gemmatimonadota bacterium]